MKKAKFLLPMLGALLLGAFATSCEPEHVPVAIESSNTRVMQQTIYWNQWQADVDYMYVTLEWDAITEDLLKYGSVVAYVYEGEYQCPLPHIYPMGEVTYENGNVDYLVEKLSYELEPGRITFIMQDLDGLPPTGLENTAPIVFRAVATVPVQYLVKK
ncbi:MAG: hypothetical protein K6E96_09460 [Bacteroidales bacterium]|nr:hypothetical protein [Bacteroidales bacterium]